MRQGIGIASQESCSVSCDIYYKSSSKPYIVVHHKLFRVSVIGNHGSNDYVCLLGAKKILTGIDNMYIAPIIVVIVYIYMLRK